MLISIEGTGNNQLELDQESMGDAVVLSNYFLLRNPGPKPTGVVEHCGDGETTCCFLNFMCVSF